MWLVLFGVVIVGAAVIQSILAGQQKGEMEAHLGVLPDFTASQMIMGCDGKSGIAVDEVRQKLCVIRRENGQILERILFPVELVSVELFEDGSSVTKTMRSSQIGGALIGGIAMGGVGAIIGGLSGKTVTSNKIKRVDLRLVVDDTVSPLHDVTFMNVEGNKNGLIHTHAMSQARHWHGILEVLIKRADAEVRSTAGSALRPPSILPSTSTNSIADELGKLAGLRAAGILTNEEFDHQKTKLLANS
jgi:hypothetical protein